MALEFEDRVLGEKVDYLCDSSDDERHEDDDGNNDSENEHGGAGDGAGELMNEQANEAPPSFMPPSRNHANTGPKGVIEDYRQYKILESFKRDQMEMERLAMAKKQAFTCNSHAEDKKLKEEEEDWEKQLEEMIDNDEFMLEYRQKRFNEMLALSEQLPTFGKVFHLTVLDFIEQVESEPSNVNVIVHIYEQGVPACDAVHGSFLCLCKEYLHVKFCRILASEANLSDKFSQFGVPALILFKGGKQVKNLVAISLELGEDFFASDLEAFLVKKGFLSSFGVDVPSKTKTIRGKHGENSDDDNDSDFDVD